MAISAVAAQFPVGLSIAENVRAIGAILDRTEPGELVVLPEGAISGYSDDIGFLGGINVDELAAALERVRAAAVRRRVYLVVGSCLRGADRWRNAALYVAPDGATSVYYKVNLAAHERGAMLAGDDLPVFAMRLGGEVVSVGIQLCRELRFPEQWRVLALRGAQVFAYLTHAANPRERPGVWRSHLISRAAENQRFVVAANMADPAQHCPTMIVSPRGDALAEANGDGQRLLRHSIELAEVSDWYLGQRREDVVALRAGRAAQVSGEGNGEDDV